MATFSNNTTIKVTQKIEGSSSSGGTKYTAPANRFAIFNLSVDGNGRWDVNNTTVVRGPTHATAGYDGGLRQGVYVGPGQTLNLDTGSGGFSGGWAGTEFSNSP